MTSSGAYEREGKCVWVWVFQGSQLSSIHTDFSLKRKLKMWKRVGNPLQNTPLHILILKKSTCMPFTMNCFYSEWLIFHSCIHVTDTTDKMNKNKTSIIVLLQTIPINHTNPAVLWFYLVCCLVFRDPQSVCFSLTECDAWCMRYKFTLGLGGQNSWLLWKFLSMFWPQGQWREKNSLESRAESDAFWSLSLTHF